MKVVLIFVLVASYRDARNPKTKDPIFLPLSPGQSNTDVEGHQEKTGSGWSKYDMAKSMFRDEQAEKEDVPALEKALRGGLLDRTMGFIRLARSRVRPGYAILQSTQPPRVKVTDSSCIGSRGQTQCMLLLKALHLLAYLLRSLEACRDATYGLGYIS